MITMTIDPDGRTWYGRKQFRVRLENIESELIGPELTMKIKTMRPSEVKKVMINVVAHEIAEGRAVNIVDNR